jgi:hypothetical protein
MTFKHWFIFTAVLLTLFVSVGIAQDFDYYTTANWNAGSFINTTSASMRYNQSEDTLEMDFPYADLRNDLVGYWRLEGKLTGEIGPTLVVAGAGTYTATNNIYGSQGYVFNGIDTQLNINDNSSFDMGNGINDHAFSVSFWVKPYNTGNYAYLSKSDWSGTTWQWDIYQYSGLIRFYISDESPSYKGIYTTAPTANAWTHIIVTYDGRGGPSPQNGMKMYFNGTLQSVSTDVYGTYTAMHNNTLPVTIGQAANLGTDYFDGEMDEIQIIRHALTQAEITDMFNNGKKHIDTKWGGSDSEWHSDAMTVPAGKQLKNISLEVGSADTKCNISYIIAVNSTNSIKYFNDTDVYSAQTITYDSDAGYDMGNINETETWNITIGFNGDGSCTASITDVYGYYENVPVVFITTMLSPLNTTYCNYRLWFNASANAEASWCGYSLDNKANVTLTNSTGNWNRYTTLTSNFCNHNVTMYCTSTLGETDATDIRYFWSCYNTERILYPAKKVLW